jgi:molybdopterin-biosynthesis enzyme MoeA-like protein
MNFGIIIIGDEILSGRREDKHLAKTIAMFGERGLQLAYADYVGDSPERITATLKRAFASGDVVFSFGGIGATPDDHTRQCAAAALQRPLVLHPEAKVLIRERMQDLAREKGLPYEPERDDNLHRLNMGMFPEGAGIIPNPYNKIPGFYVLSDELMGAEFRAGPPQATLDRLAASPVGKLAPSGGSDPHAVGERGGVYLVPGFPVMAWPMVEWVLDTQYRAHFRQDAWQENSIIVFGAMEASLTPLMEHIEATHAVKVFSLPSVDHPEYGRHIELGVKGAPGVVDAAYLDLVATLKAMEIPLGPEMVRK